jgi:hypothetical protein
MTKEKKPVAKRRTVMADELADALDAVREAIVGTRKEAGDRFVSTKKLDDVIADLRGPIE